MKKIVFLTFIIIGFLTTPSSSLAFFAPNIQCGEEASVCVIAPFSFDTGITPLCFQSPRHITTAIGWCDFIQIVSNIIGFLYALAIPVAILMIAIGGITLLVSGGNETRLKQGKGFITSALIGILIALGAGIIISFILRGLGVTDITLFPWLF